ncbi:12764_t:CDS:2 [Funneliformis geosporum]|uniref:12764_t:CDS:1 n=1 Tax=Funneliformis geosporum TaxID=1117311 RepID=A0A9W4WMU9_9GLOM|nr:12764_t:CDS:2 [Funneliformis geosporum]
MEGLKPRSKSIHRWCGIIGKGNTGVDEYNEEMMKEEDDEDDDAEGGER